MLKTVMLVLLILFVLWLAGMFFLGIKSKKAPVLGLSSNNTLQPCPQSPNCICSEYPEDKEHYAQALPLESQGEVIPIFKEVVVKTGGKIVQSGENYIRAEYISAVFRFVDDLEIRVDRESGKIQLRSASRVGRGDLGANRKRYLKIKTEYQKLISHPKN